MTAHRKDKMSLVEKGVLTEDALLAYLHDTLPPEERSEVDRLLQQDAFAREALEGMQAAPSKTEASSSLLSINEKIRHRVAGRSKGPKLIQLHWTNYAWAAVILGLLISLGFILVNYMGAKQENIALNQETTQEEPKLISADKSISQEQVTSQETETTVVATESVKPDVSQTTAAPVTTAPVTEPNQPTVANNAQPAQEGLAKEKTEAAKTNEENNTAMKSMAMRRTSSEDKAADNKDIAGEVSLETAMKSFNSGDYKNSAIQFDALLKKQPANADALYFGGISDYINEDIKKSEKSFDALLKDGGRYVEGSKWYKANILLKKGKKEEAKKILQELSNTTGSYKERASKKLSELQ